MDPLDVSHAAAFVDKYKIADAPRYFIQNVSDWHEKWVGLWAPKDWADNEDMDEMGRECLASLAAELLVLSFQFRCGEKLKSKMIEHVKRHLACLKLAAAPNSNLRACVSPIDAAVEDCVDAGATPLACMEVALKVMTVAEAAYIGW